MEKILIVDDEEAMRRLLRINLADSYEIIDTGDPEQGLALAMQNKPSAILLDLRMPRCSGFELCRTFTSMTSTQLIPVFVVSGEAGSTTKALCKELGATAYFEKPIATENVSTSGFLCGCMAKLKIDSVADVHLVTGGEQFVGKARTVRCEAEDTPYPRYA